MRAIFCGVRGSTPAPGREFVRTGGHTSCLALAHPGEPPRLILDAGTGIRLVTDLLCGRAFAGTVALTHLHWDHVQGLPFFAAGDRDDASVTVAAPAQGDPEAVLAGAMGPPHFPITPSGLRGRWAFAGWEPGLRQVEGFEVLARDVPHKGGRTFGYRVTAGGRSLAYLPDHGPRAWGDGPDGHGARHEAALALATGVDVLVHGAPYTAAERDARRRVRPRHRRVRGGPRRRGRRRATGADPPRAGPHGRRGRRRHGGGHRHVVRRRRTCGVKG